ncbi:MAG: GIY-YIG nuclease family protein [Patescibacteria group bacterium]|nr:GIY-YIG nuclease family protein [Patescibacteria group bacterium]
MKVFIYTLSHPLTDEVRYVGKTEDLRHRFSGHINENSDTHKGRWIRRIKLEGLRPKIEPIEILDNPEDSEWQEAERFWIETLKQYGCRLTNLDNGGTSGRTPSIETRMKISRSRLGTRLSEEHKLKISNSLKNSEAHKEAMRNPELRSKRSSLLIGHNVSEETKAKISAAGKARSPDVYKRIVESRKWWRPSVETREKQRIASLGRKHRPESIEKCRLINKGRKMSEETKEKLRAAMTGRTLTAEHKEKCRLANLGKKRTADAKRNISIALRKHFENKRLCALN